MIGLGLGLTRGGGIAPSLDLNFLTGTMPAGLTFTRASTATYIGSDGLLKTAAVDVPRFDYDPVTLACKGLLIEGSRTNLLLRSQEFDNASWQTANAPNITANAAVAPDGTTTADKIAWTNTSLRGIVEQIATLSALTKYTHSAFYKNAGAGSVRHTFFTTEFGNCSVDVNLTTGAVTGTEGTPDATNVIDCGNGWYRVILTKTTAATVTGQKIQVAKNITPAAANGTDGVYVWGAQFETGAYATSYIPTTTAAVTRAADVCLMTGANFSRWFNPVEGTIVAEFGLITNGLNSTGGNAFPHVYDFDSAAAPTSGHSLLASAGYGPGVRAQTQSAGVDQAAFNHAITLGTGAVMRHAYAYKTNDFASCLNGGAVATDALGILISPDRLAIGSMDAGGSNHLDGHLRRVRDWPRRLSNARLQELTA